MVETSFNTRLADDRVVDATLDWVSFLVLLGGL